jgi:hypothetical protein
MENNDIVILNLDRPRQLWCGHKALKTLSALLGKGMDEIDTNSFNMDELEKVMYCLMLTDAKNHGENIELSQMEDLLDLATFSEITAKMTAAFEAAFGSAQEISDPNVQRIAPSAKRGTGKKA